MLTRGGTDITDFSDTRRWWPECLADEVMPEGRAKPQDWLEPRPDGVTVIYFGDKYDEDRLPAGEAKPGEVLEFVWYEPRGTIDVLIKPDGTWSRESGGREPGTIDMFTGQATPVPPPAGSIADANVFALDGDWETAMDTMDEFARCFAEMEPPAAEGDRVTVMMAYWSDTVTFRVSADGKSLEAVADTAEGGEPDRASGNVARPAGAARAEGEEQPREAEQ